MTKLLRCSPPFFSTDGLSARRVKPGRLSGLCWCPTEKGRGPVRSSSETWGLESLSQREYLQLSTGNMLLKCAATLAVESARHGVSCIVEHPDIPQAAHMPSIWRLPISGDLLSTRTLTSSLSAKVCSAKFRPHLPGFMPHICLGLGRTSTRSHQITSSLSQSA